MTINQVVAGAAAVTSSSTSFTASSPGTGGTFTVASDAGYPSSGRFVVQLNRGESDEEKVLISSRTGTTFTVETRGYDGTTAQSHTNPTVNLILPATVVNALIDHADGTGTEGSDPHSTKLLNNTRHDTTSRHALGTSIPTSASAPATITPDSAGSAGAANSVARSDHDHPVTAAAPGEIQAATTTAAEGTATSLARSDHRHAVTTAVPVSVGTSLSAGTSTSFAKADHLHDLLAGAIDSTDLLADAIVTFAKIASEAPTDYSSSLTFTNVTLGGGTKSGRYWKIGRLVVGMAQFTLGATGDVTGIIEVSLPVAAGTYGVDWLIAGRGYDSSGSSGASGVGVILDGESVGKNIVTLGTNFWSASVPFNWASGDTFRSIFFYAAAT